uniref:Uncharacterized protein n=1 Tax=Mimiviridae sp. ChoanoV1 TaxID=2596887 RepID=A0A5B8IFR1_9VIRU|nr:hypothetical protein 5_65 [Mimiviridae sp. ChoanoV1]
MINKLFLYLLNRKPNQEEYKLLQNKNHRQINNYIIILEEYKDFLEKQKFIITNTLINKIGIIDNDIIIHKLMNILRDNTYNYEILEKIINNKKTQIKNTIDNQIIKLLGNKIEGFDYNEFYIIFFENNFDYKNLEFIIVNSYSFKEYVEKEIDVLYEKLF